METNRIVLAGSSVTFVAGLAACLRRRGFDVFEEIAPSEPSLLNIVAFQPDLVLIGPHLPEVVAFSLCRELTRRDETLRVMLCRPDAEEWIVRLDAIQAGAAACVPGTCSCDEYVDIATAVLSGYEAFSRAELFQAAQPARLTARELDVLAHMAGAASYQEIADLLDIAYSTVRNHAQNIIEKLECHNRDQAVRRAQRRGLI